MNWKIETAEISNTAGLGLLVIHADADIRSLDACISELAADPALTRMHILIDDRVSPFRVLRVKKIVRRYLSRSVPIIFKRASGLTQQLTLFLWDQLAEVKKNDK
ncbi:hypothetical protein F4X10_08125 [Candidatus Poribacteria bacterium]|nr:hypothetical protein [Candidatus Poribacteria bacterium]